MVLVDVHKVITNVSASVEWENDFKKIRSESGKLSTIGCQFPPKSKNFETLVL